MLSYLVKSCEEVIGNEYWVVTFPEKYNSRQCRKALETAIRYAQATPESLDNLSIDEKANFDDFLQRAKEILEDMNGQEAFNAYLKEKHQCTIRPLKVAYTYTW